jgi:hypothetical protein
VQVDMLFRISSTCLLFKYSGWSATDKKEEIILNFHDDIEKAFKPLGELTNYDKKTMGDYMYMYHEDDDTYFYKRKETREYINLKGCSGCGSYLPRTHLLYLNKLNGYFCDRCYAEVGI